MSGVDRAADARLVSWVADGKNAAEPHYQSGNRATCAPDLNPVSRAIPINSIASLCYVTLRTRTKLNRLTAGKDRLKSCMRSTLCTLTHPGRRGCTVYGQPGACSIASRPFRTHAIPAIHYPYVVCDKGSCMQLQLIDQHPSSLRFAYALCPCLYRDHAFRRNLIGEWIFQLA